jgi:hypothetical protein
VLGVLILDGDFFVPTHRSEWDPETLLEGPFDPERAVRRFEEANAIFASGQGRDIQLSAPGRLCCKTRRSAAREPWTVSKLLTI